MSSPNHYNTTAGSPPYKDLFRTVTVVPKDREIAYISTQWAADATGKLDPSTKNDYFKQAAVTWTHINAILVELGIEMKDIVHRTVSFLDFNEEIGKTVVEGGLSVTPDKWKADTFLSALQYNSQSKFHEDGMVYSVDIIVALPAKN